MFRSFAASLQTGQTVCMPTFYFHGAERYTIQTRYVQIHMCVQYSKAPSTCSSAQKFVSVRCCIKMSISQYTWYMYVSSHIILQLQARFICTQCTYWTSYTYMAQQGLTSLTPPGQGEINKSTVLVWRYDFLMSQARSPTLSIVAQWAMFTTGNNMAVCTGAETQPSEASG